MGKTILLLTLLYSVNAFASNDFCEEGCTLQEVEAKNKANFKSHEQWVREAEAWEAAEHAKWVKEHDEAQARAEALPKYQYQPGSTMDNCVADFYEKATSIIGDTAKNYVNVREIEDGKCSFQIKEMAYEMCEHFNAFSSMATPEWSAAEWCRYRLEAVAVTTEYRDIFGTPAFTDAVKQELQAKLKPIEDKHNEVIKILLEKEIKKLK